MATEAPPFLFPWRWGLSAYGRNRTSALLPSARNLASFGSAISFDVVGGTDAADDVCRKVQIIRHATSFGAVESTIERRASVRGQEHLPAGLLRLSVGIEHLQYLWVDLDQAM